MADSPAWRPLPIAASHGAPALLVSSHFTRDSYAIHVTDLANIWSEVLDRKAIYRRSLAEDTSIDPTDSPQNMLQFLARVRSALEPAHPDHQSSRATLEASAGDALALKITCEIPGLQPLKWPVHLEKSSPSTLATELVLPLLQANLAGTQQVASLLEVIQHKDAVMGKLLDKLESTGTRLEHIFTTLPAKQKVTRMVAEEKITGLAPFKKGRWKAELLEDQIPPKDVASLADAVFGNDGLEYIAGLHVETSPRLDGWWTSLEGPVPLTRASESAQREATPEPQLADEDDDDDFQVQSTPPPPSSARKAASQRDIKMKNDDSSTEEDEAPPSLPKELPKRSRLGTIAAKKRASPQPPPAPPPQAQEGSETESEPPSPKPAPSEPPRQKKPGLGRIGGGGASKAKQRSKSPETEAAAVEAPPADKPRRLGQIGRKPAAKTEDAAEAEGGPRGRRRADETTRGDPPPRETSEERANRKRDELQKELERKAAAGPARKKRKF
ncbi:XRCC4-like factor-domain-containing protein [Plectosphaerella plurivora]|uniref:Non-homologous end-joining factor 1 n=1 Tax=Plectosphaerella plurivora TaxID=936078 RepID=A0A9P8V2T9_9PEZI|nr:XRCC4-like factor-domain-containing protein [Plectosphaerella plurivora]